MGFVVVCLIKYMNNTYDGGPSLLHFIFDCAFGDTCALSPLDCRYHTLQILFISIYNVNFCMDFRQLILHMMVSWMGFRNVFVIPFTDQSAR